MIVSDGIDNYVNSFFCLMISNAINTTSILIMAESTQFIEAKTYMSGLILHYMNLWVIFQTHVFHAKYVRCAWAKYGLSNDLSIFVPLYST